MKISRAKIEGYEFTVKKGKYYEGKGVDAAVEENCEYTYGVSAVGADAESGLSTITVYTRTGYFLYKPYIESANFQ